MAFVKAFQLGLDTAFVHSGGKFDNHILSVDKNIITTKVHGAAIQASHFRVQLGGLQALPQQSYPWHRQ